MNNKLVANKLNLNVLKNEYIVIGSCQNLKIITADSVINLDNQWDFKVYSTKNLGFIIDGKLGFSKYTAKLAYGG